MIESIGIFVATKIASYAISKRLDKLFTNRNTFERRLAKVIDRSIDEYHNTFPIPDEDGKFAFYKSQLFVEELLKLRFFGDTAYKVDKSTIIKQISKNKNIILPTREQLSDFLEIFEKHRRADDELKNLEIEKNYKEQIFRNTDKLDQIIELLEQYGGIAGSLPKELTARIPKVSQGRIIGRDADLTDLYERLFNNRQVVLVNGLGGIGKTAVAQVYAAKYWDEYHHIAWITQTSGDIMSDIITTEGLLDVLNISREGKKPKDLFINIVTTFKKFENAPNLLIIDNADNSLSQLYDYLPGQPLWHILVTSREKIQKFDLKELDFLSEDDGVSLFLSHYSHGNIPDDEIKELIKTVDYHTLTIEILAITAQLQRTDINKLKKAIEDDLKANVYIDYKGDKIERVTSYLSSIFSLSDLNENEIWLMKQFVCLPSEFLNYHLLKELINPDAHQKGEVFSENLEELAAKGWLLHNRETDSYKMHVIISNVFRNQQSIDLIDVEPLIENVSEKLSIDRTKDNPVDKFIWIPFGKRLITVMSVVHEKFMSVLQNNLALVIQSLGDYSGAKELFEKAMRSDEKNFGVDHPTTSVSYSNLATVLQDLGDYSGAKELLEKAILSDETNFGIDHPTTAVRYSNLALVLRDLGDYSGAKELLKKAVHSAETNFGIDHPTTAVRYSNLATVLKDLGDYSGAKELFEKAMRSDETNFGIDHPTTAVRYSNLATVLQELGDHSGARELLEKAMRSSEKNFGDDHPTTAASYSNLALVLQALGDYFGAKELLEKAMRSDEKNLGIDHPTTAVCYSNLATVLKDLGDHSGAKELLEKAMHSAEKYFGFDHPTTAVYYSNLSTVFNNLGEYDKALELSKKGLEILQNKLPPEHPGIRTVKNNIESIKDSIRKKNKS